MSSDSTFLPFGTSSIHTWRHIPSRPSSRRSSSRARSDATERPDRSAFISPSLSHEIDYIKTLIGRSQEAPPLPPAGILTAQVFRQPTPTISTVTQGQIYLELDQLKRRIRQELDSQQRHPLIRRTSQIDPGQESEGSDLEDNVLDEREEELEKARDDVALVRQRLDGLLERAEARVDCLANEKEKLESTLAWYRHELDRSESDRRGLAQALDKIRTDIRQLNSVLEGGADRNYEEQKERLAVLQDEKLQADAAYEKAQQEVTELSRVNRELETALGSARDDHNKSAEQLRIHDEKHDSTNAKLRSEIVALEKAHGEKDSEIESSRSIIQELQSKLSKAERHFTETKKEYETRIQELSAQVRHDKELSESALRETDTLKNEHEQAIKDRDSSRARIDELQNSLDQYQVKLGASIYAQQRLEQQVKDDDFKHEKAIRTMQESHDAERKQLEESLLGIKDGHSQELENAQSRAANELQAAKAQHADEITRLTAGSSSELDIVNKAHASALASAKELHSSELEIVRSEHEAHLRTLNEKLAQAAHDSQATASAHASKIETLRSEYEARLRALTDKLEQAANDSESAATAHASKLEAVRIEYETRLQALTDKLEQAADASKATATAHASELENVRSQYEARVQALTDKLEQAADASKATATAHASELETARSEQSSAMETFRKAENALQLRTQYLVAKLGEAEQHVVSLEATMSDMDKSGNTRLDEMTSQLSLQAEEFSRASTELASLREKTNAQIADMEATHRKMSEEAEKRQRLLEADHAQEISRLVQEHKSAIETALSEAEEKHREKDSHTEAESEVRVRKLKDGHALELQRQSAKHGLSLEAVKLEADGAHQAALDVLRKDLMGQQTQLQSDHRQECTRLENLVRTRQEEHQQSIAKMRQDHEKQVLDITTRGSTESQGQIEELRKMHESRLAGLEGAHKSALDNMSGAHAAAMENADSQYKSLEAAHKAAQDSLQQDSADQISRLKEGHASDISQLRASLIDQTEAAEAAGAKYQRANDELVAAHNATLATLKNDFDTEKGQTSTKHEAAMSAVQTELDIARHDAKDMHSKHLEEVQQLKVRHDIEQQAARSKAQEEITRLRQSADDADESQNAIQAKHRTELEALESSNSVQLHALEEKLEAELAKHSNMASEHERDLKSMHDANAKSDAQRQQELAMTISQLKTEYEKRLEDAEAKHIQALSYREGVWNAKFDELKDMHAKSTAEALAVSASNLHAVEQRHADDPADNSEGTLSDSQEGESATSTQRGNADDSAAVKVRQSRRAEVRSMKRRHQDAIAHVRSTAQKQYAAQITELEEAHQRELKAAEERIAVLEQSRQHEPGGGEGSTAKMHQDEISRVEHEYQSKVTNLERQLQDRRTLQGFADQGDHQSIIQDLKARLDASLRAQAEAEKSLVALRRQDEGSDKGSRERRGSDPQLHALQPENRNPKKQVSFSSLNLRRSRGGSGRISPVAGSSIDVASLNMRMANIEEEREALRKSLAKRSEERLDLLRQNDFLVKELEVSLSRSSKAQRPSAAVSDAVVQTDDSTLEAKAEFSVLHSGRERVRIRPETPSSPVQDQSRGDDGMIHMTSEEYLDNAASELSGSGSVISHNESPFQRKIPEHVDGLQKSKDELAADYTTKIESLTSNKERMEETLEQKQQATLAKEREELLATFGAHEHGVFDHDMVELPALESLPALEGLSAAQVIALRAAEQKLVVDYHRRLASRKSQIALKHDYEFQRLTADYNREVDELLDDRSKLEGDLSVEPSKFERDPDQINKSSLTLETERGRATQRDFSPHSIVSPLRSSDSGRPKSPAVRSPVSPATTPGASRRIRLTTSPPPSDSLPRSTSKRIVLVPEEDEMGQDTIYHPLRSPERHAPVQQHSLMRTKSPSKMQYPSNNGPKPLASKPGTGSPAGTGPVFSPILPLTYQPGPLPPPGRRIRSRPPRDSAIESPAKRLSAYVEEEGGGEKKAPAPAKPGLLRRVRDKLSISSDHSHQSHHSKQSDFIPPRPATSAAHIAVMSSASNEPRPGSAASWHAKRSGSRSARGRLG
ncbi:uncharacterized protein MYCGRDRAFT_108494 [Zymoseptoria tritici IPO323]|uniref:Uncharacterized protein n=1 Tax=Zymoseptoria tritici (strain CBS 115943 / IPO323) TaxID=336722 RepID=F9X5I1_ZYMTI|nr:uncharacterized protein MYCGRDRAFT_108494 [Zymoseptoria tritici IPO323]EGP88688.1 hypothetical protein MYCGRDRAFT_108494 [Zymoseptoria tritici IPO323]